MKSGVLFVHSLPRDLFRDHVTHDTHHGGAAIVDLSVQFPGLLFRVLDVAAEVSDAVVAIVLARREPGNLDEAEEGDNLSDTRGGHGEDSINSGGDVGELKVVGRGQVTVEHDVVVVHDGSDNGSHGNTAMLPLDGATTLERFGFSLHPS